MESQSIASSKGFNNMRISLYLICTKDINIYNLLHEEERRTKKNHKRFSS